MNSPRILDIRTDEEYCSGHICGATLIETPLPPLSKEDNKELFENLFEYVQDERFPSNTPIYVYCKKGIRAGVAVSFLRGMGFSNVRSIGGVEVPPLSQILKGKPSLLCYCED